MDILKSYFFETTTKNINKTIKYVTVNNEMINLTVHYFPTTIKLFLFLRQLSPFFGTKNTYPKHMFIITSKKK